MLPRAQGIKGIDLYDPASWPADGPAPDVHLLGQVAAVRAALAPVDSRMIHIIGVNQDTVVGVRRTGGGFEYAMDRNGDGTVPLAFAKLPGLKSYFVDESHADLANNARVIQAVIDLVRRGRTDELQQPGGQTRRHTLYRRRAAANGRGSEDRLAAPDAGATRSGIRPTG